MPERAHGAGPTLHERYARELTARGYDAEAAQRSALERLETLFEPVTVRSA